MKKMTKYIAIAFLAMFVLDACGPKAACGNSRKNTKKKTKELRSNGGFNMY